MDKKQVTKPKLGPKVSVISIIAGVAPYLPKCIDSLLAQDWKNLEIILVVGVEDTAHPDYDDCYEVVREKTDFDDRVKTIVIKKNGVGDARNRGLKEATGQYIAFVDGDDWVEPGFVSHQMKMLQEHLADIAVCGKWSEYPDGSVADAYKPVQELNAEASFRMILEGTGFFFHCWDKLFKAELWEGVTFPTDRYVEDRYIVGSIVEKANKIVFDRTPLYHFRVRSDSLSRISTMSELNTEADIEFCKYTEKRFPSLKEQCEAFLLYDHITCVQNALVNGSFTEESASEHLSYIREHRKNASKNSYINRNTRIKAFLAIYFRPGLKLITKRGQQRAEKQHEKFSISE
ncbi:Glycosyl transferase family 2 [Lachnospiraceae bacterium]|nr:Glycosyl transferase family 2 [Lachnospiraceae bacterium]